MIYSTVVTSDTFKSTGLVDTTNQKVLQSVALRSGSTIANEVYPRRGYC